MNFVRAERRALQLPEGIDRNSAREVLEFATRSSYPTSPDPLLAVAHVAVQIILTMHDEIHALAGLQREFAELEQRAERDARFAAAVRGLVSLNRNVFGVAELAGLIDQQHNSIYNRPCELDVKE